MKILHTSTLTTILALVGIAIFTFQVYAADEATVTATVTVQNISVSVADGSVAYGTLAVNTSAGTNGTDTQTATNDGNVTVDLNIRGSNSVAWTLSGTAGVDTYVHRFCTTSCASPPTSYTALTTSYQTLASTLAAAGDQTFDLYITTPTSSSSYVAQNVNVTVQAVLP